MDETTEMLKMKQEKLEKRVEHIFEKQDFELEKDSNSLTAVKNEIVKKIQVFSSKEYSEEEVRKLATEDSLIFVDEELSNLQEELDNEVSIIHDEEDDREYDLPSYELIGDIAVINDLAGRDEDESVEGILEHHPHVKTILLKEEPLSGEFRVGGYRKLFGEETETIHKEHGCRFKVDPTKVYFSERLGTERKRVIEQIEDGEYVLVIGAGVGPYPILAAKKANPEKVVAVEKNPEAFKLLEENIELNKVSDNAYALKGDFHEIELDNKFDRVILAIPEFSDYFLSKAFKLLEKQGTLYYYTFKKNVWNSILQDIDEKVEKDYEINNKIICGERGPSVDRVCMELKRTG